MKVHRVELTKRVSKEITIHSANSYKMLFVQTAAEGRISKICVRQRSGGSVAYKVDLFDCIPYPFLAAAAGPAPTNITNAPGQSFEASGALPGTDDELELYRIFGQKTSLAGAAVADYASGNEGYSYRSGDGGFAQAVRGVWLLIKPTADPGADSVWECTLVIENDVG